MHVWHVGVGGPLHRSYLGSPSDLLRYTIKRSPPRAFGFRGGPQVLRRPDIQQRVLREGRRSQCRGIGPHGDGVLDSDRLGVTCGLGFLARKSQRSLPLCMRREFNM